jgi:hypothetical protein
MIPVAMSRMTTLPFPKPDIAIEVTHHFAETIDRERLRSVAEGVIRIVVDFDEYSICSGGHCCTK